MPSVGKHPQTLASKCVLVRKNEQRRGSCLLEGCVRVGWYGRNSKTFLDREGVLGSQVSCKDI